MSVRTTLDSRLQRIADSALRYGLSAYDRRHGWRGPLCQVDVSKNWQKAIKAHLLPADVTEWRTAVARSVGDQDVDRTQLRTRFVDQTLKLILVTDVAGDRDS